VINAAGMVSEPEYYIPIQDDIARRSSMYLTVRTNGNVAAMQEQIRVVASNIDSRLPVQFSTLTQRTSDLTAGSRFNAVVLGLFSLVGLLLGASGVYGVVSFLVAQRTRELGVRMALGATSRQVGQLVLRYALVCAVAGCMAAAVLMFAVLPKLQGLLFETRAVNGRTGIAVLVLMALVALSAALSPALRAARLDPVDALRQDG
jgi:putative ABC transport system permease protein